MAVDLEMEVGTLVTPSLHPQTVASLEDYDDDTKGELAQVVTAFDTAYKGIAQVFEAREKAKTNPSWNEATQTIMAQEFADKQAKHHPSLYGRQNLPALAPCLLQSRLLPGQNASPDSGLQLAGERENGRRHLISRSPFLLQTVLDSAHLARVVQFRAPRASGSAPLSARVRIAQALDVDLDHRFQVAQIKYTVTEIFVVRSEEEV